MTGLQGQQQPYTAIIFDLGDVLFQWSAETKTSISPRTLHSILNSQTWFEYERGRLNEVDCYRAISQEFDISTDEIRQAFQEARDSLRANDDFISLIRELKTQSNGDLQIYAMSNISLPDWEVLRTKPADWSIFDQVFTSGSVGERKPNLGFYRHIISATGINPRWTIFVDDKLENVLSARSLGFCGIVFDSPSTVKRALRNLTGDPIERGRNFLERNAGNLKSVTRATSKHESVVVEENFAQLLILEVTNHRKLVNLVEHPRTWNFFQGDGQLTTKEFPFDLDTTSLGLTIIERDRDIANSVMDEMLEYVDRYGIIQTYFDHRRPRFDPVVCVNALSLFHTYGRGHELQQTLDWVYQVLLNRAYLEGTRYYETAECFLYTISRLIAKSKDAQLHALLKPLLRERVQERIGTSGDSLALAMRILVCDSVGLRNAVDLRTLLALQCEDGGWEIGWMYKYGSSGISIGNRGLTVALAIEAVQAMTQLLSCGSSTPTSVNQESLPSPPRLPARPSHKKDSTQHVRKKRKGGNYLSQLYHKKRAVLGTASVA